MRFPFATAVLAWLDADALKARLPFDADLWDHTFNLGCIVDDCLDAAIACGSWPHDVRFWGGEAG